MRTSASSIPRSRVKRWSRDEYHELIKLGALDQKRLYLFRGEFIETPRQTHAHAFTITQLNGALYSLFGEYAWIRIRVPFCPPGDSEPEPDAAVCTDEQANEIPHPSSALLVIEVSDESIHEDRAKGEEYAAAGVPDYWIIDVNNRRTEVYRDPIADDLSQPGWRYSAMQTYAEDAPIAPLAAAGKSIVLADLLPARSA